MAEPGCLRSAHFQNLEINGDVHCNSNLGVSVVSSTAIEGGASVGAAAAIPVTGTVSLLKTDTNESYFSLANGTIAGQMKILIHSSLDNTTPAVIKPANLGPGSTLTSDSANSMGLMLVWTGSTWWPCGDKAEWAIG